MNATAVGLVLCACACAAFASEAAPEPLAELFRSSVTYDVETAVLLNDVTRKDREIGYKIKATLTVQPVWTAADDTEFILRFDLESPQLHLRGKHVSAEFLPHASVWDSHAASTFYGRLRGPLLQPLLDPADPFDVLNYKKSLLSLFQFQPGAGERNETDVSGACEVLYETISADVFRKIKRRCSQDAAAGTTSARRATRYTLAARALHALHADELVTVGDAALGLKARAWHSLRARASAVAHPARTPAAPPLPPALRDLPLAMDLADDDDLDDETPLHEALERDRAALEGEEAGAGGDSAAAAAALRLLPVLRAAGLPALRALLDRAEPQALPGLCRMLGLAGTPAAHAAVADFLQLRAPDPLEALAHVYLAAFALAPEPTEETVLAVLRLGEEARAAAVGESALLASAAAAARQLDAAPEAARAAADALSRTVRDSLARGLARCKDDACRAGRLHALGNLRRADTVEALAGHAEREGGGAAPLAAVLALDRAPPRALSAAHLDRLDRLALRPAAPLELRAAALDLVARRRVAEARGAVSAPLVRLALALHDGGPHELRRLLRQRLAALAPDFESARALLAALPPALRTWDARAASGTSGVLARETGWAGGGWRARLEAVQVARGGLLRRAAVALHALAPDGLAVDALTVEVWTRGLETLAGTDAAGAAEEAAGGLAIAVGGVRARGVTLFEGQAELLGHVWAGTGAAPTPALRALRPLRATRGRAALAAGAVLRVEARAALALALDAQATVSLWWRTARTELVLRAGAADETRAAVRTAWGELSARAASAADPRLRIAADLDFYDAVALCVRARTEDHECRRDVELESAQGARRARVRRETRTRVHWAGRTLALGRPNDATCRTLRAAEEPAEAA